MGMKITAPTPTDRRALALRKAADSLPRPLLPRLLSYKQKQRFTLAGSYVYIYIYILIAHFYGGFKQLPLLPVVAFQFFSLHRVKPLQGEWSRKKKERERENK